MNKHKKKLCNILSEKRNKVIITIVITALEVLFWTTEEALDLIFTLPDYFDFKALVVSLRITFNICFFVLLLVFLYGDHVNALLLHGLTYLVIGIVAFLYLLVERNNMASMEARGLPYYEYHIDLITEWLYYLSGIMIFFGGIAILAYANDLASEIKRKKNEEKQNLLLKYEVGKNNNELEIKNPLYTRIEGSLYKGIGDVKSTEDENAMFSNCEKDLDIKD